MIGDACEAPGRIRALDPTLANQIAAGEVVERPASVLKELLENSLDAGARRIRVDASRGGTVLLKVSDDGAGIVAEDLRLALERHATSKIATLAELESVSSMGFRGEALPSIASVSRLAIESRARGADVAWRVAAEGGAAGSAPLPASHPPGTTVTVRDLFFNTPVRRRFLRTPATELRHLDRVFRRLALSAFAVAMSLRHDGRELLQLPAADGAAARRRRVARLLGRPFADGALALERAAAGMRVWGFLGAPREARERGDAQHLYVNGRPVTDATVRHAVRLGYGDRLDGRAQPAWLLYLELDPRDVDVNVHPAKHEVRFREARMVHDFVRSAVRAALDGDAGVADAAATPPPRFAARGEDAAAQPRGGPGSGAAAEVLAVLADGLVAARRGETLLLARGVDLRRAWARRALHAAAAGGGATSRPILIPERVVFRGGAPGEPVLAALERLGFELRASAADAVLLLAVPEVLAGASLEALGAALGAPPANPGDAAAWVAALAEVAAGVAVDEAGAARILRALHDDPPDPAPWVELDGGALAALLPAGR